MIVLIAALALCLLLLAMQIVRTIELPAAMLFDLELSDVSDDVAVAPSGNPGALFGRDAYPPDAVRAGAEGRTVVTLIVDDKGRTRGCVLDSSSGHTSLDDATCRIGRRVGFEPGRDSTGLPVVAAFKLPVRWQLEE